MARQNNVTLSRETKKEILKAHMHYIREELETCERAYKKGDKELFGAILSNLYTYSFYLEDLGIFSKRKSLLLNHIIDHIVDGFFYRKGAKIA